MKKLQLDMYVGSVKQITQEMWILNQKENIMQRKAINFIPALHKVESRLNI